MEYFVYILTNVSHSSLYIGVTNNLARRLYEHQNELADGFTKKYKARKLVYFEQGSDVNAALSREKQLKHWSRRKKIDLINSLNPLWLDLGKESGMC